MEFFDSHETEQESKEFSKKVNDFLSNIITMSEDDLKFFQEDYLDAIKTFKVVIPPLLEKAKKEELTEEERELFINTYERYINLKQGLENMLLVLGNSLKKHADRIFFNIKQQALNGDPKAKELYADLLPKYKETLLSDDIEDLN